MDVVEFVPQVQRGERDGDVVHLDGSADLGLGESPSLDLRVLTIDRLEKIDGILKRYNALQIPKPDPRVFVTQLTQDRSSWWLEVGDVGVVYFTNVVPTVGAELHVLFWDGKLSKDRAGVVREAVRMATENFSLARVSALCVWSNLALKKFLKRVGFTYEGTVRKGWVDERGFHDTLFFGIISEEL